MAVDVVPTLDAKPDYGPGNGAHSQEWTFRSLTLGQLYNCNFAKASTARHKAVDRR